MIFSNCRSDSNSTEAVATTLERLGYLSNLISSVSVKITNSEVSVANGWIKSMIDGILTVAPYRSNQTLHRG